MNAYELYEAAFDTAIDCKPATAGYVQEYAIGVFDLCVSNEICEQIAEKRAKWLVMTESGEATADGFWHSVQKPLEEIEL